MCAAGEAMKRNAQQVMFANKMGPHPTAKQESQMYWDNELEKSDQLDKRIERWKEDGTLPDMENRLSRKINKGLDALDDKIYEKARERRSVRQTGKDQDALNDGYQARDRNKKGEK